MLYGVSVTEFGGEGPALSDFVAAVDLFPGWAVTHAEVAERPLVVAGFGGLRLAEENHLALAGLQLGTYPADGSRLR